MRRRVLFMISSMHGGGSEQQTLLMLRHVDRSRFQPFLYLTQRAGDLLDQVPNDVAIHAFDDEAPVGGLHYPGKALRQQTNHLAAVLRKNSIDVIYDRTFHMTMIAGPAARRTSTPRVSTIVSPPSLALPLVEQRYVSIKRRRLSQAYARSKRVIAVSRQAANSAEEYYQLAANSIRVIPNPVDIDQITLAAEAKAPTRDSSFTFACVGRMTSEKGHADLLEALRIASQLDPGHSERMTAWLIGDGPLMDRLQATAGTLPKNIDVQFLGRQSNPAPFIRAADCLVLPSRFEGMPNVVLEAMALRTPVVATNAGGTRELQRKSPTMLLVDPQNATQLAAAIQNVASDKEAASQRVESAWEMIQRDHSVQGAVASVEQELAVASQPND